MPSITVIVPSAGRPSLRGTLVDSIVPQLRSGDRVIVDVDNEAPWGHRTRNRWLAHRVETDIVLFQDDDDFFVYGALDKVRAAYALNPGRLHVFQMRYIENDFVIWEDKELRVGNVSTQMLCAPGPPYPQARFGGRYEGDFDFAVQACALLGPPVWVADVISLVHHPLLRMETPV